MRKLLFLTVSCIVFVHQAADAMLPLHRAVSVGDKDQVDFLLKNSDTNVNQPDDDGKTPLYIAVSYDWEVIVRLLLKHGANVDQSDNDGKTPLYKAVLYGKEAVARLLLKHGANVNQQDNNGKAPLYWAVFYCNEASVRLLLKHGANVNQPNNDGWAPLHRAALNGHEVVVRLLLEHKAAVNQPGYNGKTPLYWAEQNDKEAVVRYDREAVVRLLQTWPIMQEQAHKAQLAFCAIQHPRLGAKSPAQDLPQYSIREILQHVQPSDFPAIPAVVAPVVPAHATPVPTVPQQALAQSILSNPRVQIAATTITVLSFVAWRLLHH